MKTRPARMPDKIRKRVAVYSCARDAVKALESGGNREVISEAMGKQHKVRSFYNNILDPHSPNGDVTRHASRRRCTDATARWQHRAGDAQLRQLSRQGAASRGY